jgi:hypothetical protein
LLAVQHAPEKGSMFGVVMPFGQTIEPKWDSRDNRPGNKADNPFMGLSLHARTWNKSTVGKRIPG